MPARMVRSTIDDVKDCPNTINDVKLEASFETVNSSAQTMDLNLELPFELDSSVYLDMTVFERVNGKAGPILHITKNQTACPFLSHILGDLWLEFQKDAEMPAGCIMKPGKYRVRNFLLDLNKVRHQLVPVGSFLTEFKLSKKRKVIMCKLVQSSGGPK